MALPAFSAAEKVYSVPSLVTPLCQEMTNPHPDYKPQPQTASGADEGEARVCVVGVCLSRDDCLNSRSRFHVPGSL
jgi:hypothetical protein